MMFSLKKASAMFAKLEGLQQTMSLKSENSSYEKDTCLSQ
jgi:hypothetical protein